MEKLHVLPSEITVTIYVKFIDSLKAATLDINDSTLMFKYPEVVYNHYKYRHMVDDCNARRQSPISLEESWSTRRWANRVFAFILGVSEVNAMLAEAYFSDTP